MNGIYSHRGAIHVSTRCSGLALRQFSQVRPRSSLEHEPPIIFALHRDNLGKQVISDTVLHPDARLSLATFTAGGQTVDMRFPNFP